MTYENDDFLDVDLDWFAVDSDGRVAHFASASTGFIPSCLKDTIGELEAAFDALFEVDECTTEVIIEENLPEFDTQAQREQYLSTFVSMARRGYFSFDVAKLDRKNSGYVLVARPAKAILVSALTSKTVSNADFPKLEHEQFGDKKMAITCEDFGMV